MRLTTSNYTKTVDVGTGTIWYSLFSTIMLYVPEEVKNTVPDAIDFLKEGACSYVTASAISKQMRIIKDSLKNVDANKAILDFKHSEHPAPWKGHISKDVTSCADLYLTADGKNLIDEVVKLLEFADETKVAIEVG